MAGSIEDNAAIYKKLYTYVPPTPPADLVDSTSFTIDFAGRKFIHVGVDPTCDSTTNVLIITPARHIVVTADFLQSMFNMMGNILSYLLDAPKYKRNIFLSTETTTLSNMAYKGENVLVMESKTQDGCRVILSRDDLMRLLDLEEHIFKAVTQKAVKTHSKDSSSCEAIDSPSSPNFSGLFDDSSKSPPNYGLRIKEEEENGTQQFFDHSSTLMKRRVHPYR